MSADLVPAVGSYGPAVAQPRAEIAAALARAGIALPSTWRVTSGYLVDSVIGFADRRSLTANLGASSPVAPDDPMAPPVVASVTIPVTYAFIDSGGSGFQLEISAISDALARMWRTALLDGATMSTGIGGTFAAAGFGFVLDTSNYLIRACYLPAATERDSTTVLAAASKKAATFLRDFGIAP